MIAHELETFLRIYDRCIRFGCVTVDEFDQTVELSREIAVTQPIDATALFTAMIERMETRMREPADEEINAGD